MRLLISATVALLLAAAASCSGGDDGEREVGNDGARSTTTAAAPVLTGAVVPYGTGAIDACSLLTPDAVADALGVTGGIVARPASGIGVARGVGTATCDFTSEAPGPPGSFPATVDASVATSDSLRRALGDDSVTAATRFDTVRTALAERAEVVADLGVAAYRGPAGLVVLASDAIVLTLAASGDDAVVDTRLEPLARVALERVMGAALVIGRVPPNEAPADPGLTVMVSGREVPVCSLLSSEQVAAALGTAVGSSTSDVTGGGAAAEGGSESEGVGCYYEASDAELDPSLVLAVFGSDRLRRAGVARDAAAYYDAQRALYGDAADPVAGLGDGAFYAGTLTVLAGDAVLQLSVNRPGPPGGGDRSVLTEIATELVDRLG